MYGKMILYSHKSRMLNLELFFRREENWRIQSKIKAVTVLVSTRSTTCGPYSLSAQN